VAEIGGEPNLDIDKWMRTFGLGRNAKKQIKMLDAENLKILEVYTQGINDFVANMKVYPFEFYLTWQEFHTWTVEDTLTVQGFLQYLITFDWFMEVVREKLLDIYDWNIVAKMLPFKGEDYYHDDMILINDEDLKKRGLFEGNSNIYEFDPNLLYFRKDEEPKKEKLHYFEEEMAHGSGFSTAPVSGSNCFVVGGQHTETGKPILACDPHLVKWMQSLWYFSRLRWGKDNFIVGGNTPGMPMFTYARTKHLAYGATALNPDITDTFVEQIEGDNYLYEGEWLPIEHEYEVIKVRFGSDYILDLQHTKNGVIMHKLGLDSGDFAAFFPKEILNQNNVTYSLRWVYHDPQATTIYTMIKGLCEDVKDGEHALQMFQ